MWDVQGIRKKSETLWAAQKQIILIYCKNVYIKNEKFIGIIISNDVIIVDWLL